MATISSAFDGNIQALNSVHDTSPSSRDIVTLCDMIVCFWGPTWGTSMPHAGAPLVQSMVILDRAPNKEVTDLLKPLCCNPKDQDDLAKVNKEVSYIVFRDEDGEPQEFNQIILTMAALPLPEGHKIPGGCMIPVVGLHSVDDLISSIATITQSNKAKYGWLDNTITDAWVHAAARNPDGLVTHAISCSALNSPMTSEQDPWLQ